MLKANKERQKFIERMLSKCGISYKTFYRICKDKGDGYYYTIGMVIHKAVEDGLKDEWLAKNLCNNTFIDFMNGNKYGSLHFDGGKLDGWNHIV